MNPLQEILEAMLQFNTHGRQSAEQGEDTVRFLFDDEPLERILYGEDLPAASSANLFLGAREAVDQIDDAMSRGNVEDALRLAAELGKQETVLSERSCRVLAGVLRQVVPSAPCPLLRHDLSELAELVRLLWASAGGTANPIFLNSLGTTVFRWYEHHHQYQAARKVLQEMIELARSRGDTSNEGIALNNFAFNLLLEGRPREAAPLFERAVELFAKCDNAFELMNARANFWLCLIESNDIKDINQLSDELPGLTRHLKNGSAWQRRKPLIIKAWIAEQRGEISKALALVKKAVKICRDCHSFYPQRDAETLRRLQGKLGEPDNSTE